MNTLFYSFYFLICALFGLKISNQAIKPLYLILYTCIYSILLFFYPQFFIPIFLIPLLFVLKKENYLEAIFSFTLFILLLTLINLFTESKITTLFFLILGFTLFMILFKKNPILLTNRNKIVLCIVFLLFDLIFTSYTNSIYQQYNFTQVYFLKRKNIILFITISFILFLIYFVTIVLSQYKTKIESKSYKEFIQISNVYTSQMINEQKQIQLLIHDMRNSLDTIKTLANNQDYTQLESEINESLLKYGKMYPNSICTNPYLNVVLKNFITSKGLDIDFKISVPEKINIEPSDLIILLSSLLDSSIDLLHIHYTDYELCIHVRYEDNFKLSSITNSIVTKYKGQLSYSNLNLKIILFTE